MTESLTEASLSASLASDDERESRAERREEGLKEPNQRSTVGEADPHNAEEAEVEQKMRRGAERHPEPTEAAEWQQSLTAPSEEP